MLTIVFDHDGGTWEVESDTLVYEGGPNRWRTMGDHPLLIPQETVVRIEGDGAVWRM